VPSRWIALVVTALIPLAALGMQACWTAVRKRRGNRVAYTLVAFVVVLSALELTIQPSRPASRRHRLRGSIRL
jgi:hypothetical protein